MAPATAAPEEFIVLASLKTRPAAERWVASLGHKFRRVARKGDASALVLSVNPDGSLELTQSRTLTASGVTAALLGAAVAWTVGFLGLVSTLRGARATAHAARIRESHVGSDEKSAHAILAEAGRHSALALVRCKDREMWRAASTRAAEVAIYTWHGSLADLLAALDPGSQHDWVRAALGQPSSRRPPTREGNRDAEGM